MNLVTAYPALPPISSRSPPAQGLSGVGPAEWSIFWKDFGEGDQRPERCHIPGDGQPVVDRHWLGFAAVLPRSARVIDIGCGAGTVGRTLLGHRPDILVSGIDFAQIPSGAAPGLTLHPCVPMEALPFGESCFDAAVSLFGIEYGAIGDTARELARVLKPGAAFSFVIHHCGSEIAREGAARVSGIRDALSCRVKNAFLAGDSVRLGRQRMALLKRHPGEPTVQLIGDYFRRNIAQTRAVRLAMWQKLEQDVAVEVALTAQMTRSAKSAGQIGSWLEPLLSAMAKVNVSVLRRNSREPIGWAVEGTR